jgi:hypothetical protein
MSRIGYPQITQIGYPQIAQVTQIFLLHLVDRVGRNTAAGRTATKAR